MATITMQRDLVSTFKKETVLNIGILSKLQSMPPDLIRQVFKENALEKPTQNLFNHLTHYLVSIIDHQASMLLSWPLYDTKTERAYRNDLANLVNDYSNKGLLSPVMSSYFVNPSCYKIIKLMFQLSQLAVQRLLKSKMDKDHQKKLYNEMTEKYKSQEQGFVEQIECETGIMLSKFSNYMYKRKALEKTAAVLRKSIYKMETKLESTNAQKFLDNLVDNYVSNHTLDNATKEEILNIKNVNKQSQFFNSWLIEMDQKIDEMESKWSEKVSPLMHICTESQFCTESLIARHTGEADKNSYMIEYNHKVDEICTKDLQDQVNTEQKYVLMNIIKDERLSIPNLIRAFVIAISFILKNTEVGDEIYKFNEYFAEGKRNYSETVEDLKVILERVMIAEAKLEPRVTYYRPLSIKNFPEIPPLPDFSNLYCSRDLQRQLIFDRYTPLMKFKHQFNLRRKSYSHTFSKPQSKTLFITPFNQQRRDDHMKSLISFRTSSFDRLNVTQNCHNISMISHCNKANEPTSTSGFTKHQLLRLLSTKKSSSSKKLRYKTTRPDINVKKGGLFNESSSSNESQGLFRSYSSPNLYENREKRQEVKQKKLSIMPEDSIPTLMEVSGIAALDKDINSGTPHARSPECLTKSDSAHFPALKVTQPSSDQDFYELVEDFNVDLNKVVLDGSPKAKDVIKTETPVNNTHLIRKTSSLEKIINRFKKVRASVLPNDIEKPSEFRSIAEEKENINVNVNVFTANRVLLPDLLSPSCSFLSKMSVDYLDTTCMDAEKKVCRKPRESLGTALGVDETILDQFDLID